MANDSAINNIEVKTMAIRNSKSETLVGSVGTNLQTIILHNQLFTDKKTAEKL